MKEGLKWAQTSCKQVSSPSIWFQRCHLSCQIPFPKKLVAILYLWKFSNGQSLLERGQLSKWKDYLGKLLHSFTSRFAYLFQSIMPKKWFPALGSIAVKYYWLFEDDYFDSTMDLKPKTQYLIILYIESTIHAKDLIDYIVAKHQFIYQQYIDQLYLIFSSYFQH